MAIAIETNHGGHYGLNMMDPGAVSGSHKEAIIAQTLNSKILKIVGGHDASDFSASTVNQNLVNQVANMNRYAKASGWNLSHHLNAFNRQANGVEVWYYAGDEVARKKAVEVSAAISGALGLVNRGAKPTTNFYVVSNSVGHTLLIEWCFIDNDKDIAALMSKMDQAVNALVKCFGYTGTGNVSGGTQTPPSSSAKPNGYNTTAGASQPDRRGTPGTSIGHLDEFGRNSVTSFYTRGWHIGNYAYQYIILMDYNTNKELDRKRAPGVSRPDVNKAHNTSGNVGFSVSFALDKLKGRRVYAILRCTNDPEGNVKGGHSDISYRDHWTQTI